jgi:16S rRNA C1402 (ribose-2'-O) methylase RsmI
VLGNRKFCLVKEISKRHEKAIRGELKNLQSQVESETILGEIVIVIEGKNSAEKGESVPRFNCQDDVFAFFRDRYGLSKNTIKKALMKK